MGSRGWGRWGKAVEWFRMSWRGVLRERLGASSPVVENRESQVVKAFAQAPKHAKIPTPVIRGQAKVW